MGLFNRFKTALTKTRAKVVSGFRSVLPIGRAIDESLLEDLQDMMILDDFGPATAERLIATVREAWKKKEIAESQDIIAHLKKQIIAKWPDDARSLARAATGPTVV
ncbi:MAG: signal recognition particle receptor subunit alpha, partial [Phycisphaerae bacterium]